MGKEIDLNDHCIEAAADELDEIFHTAADISFKQTKTKKRYFIFSMLSLM
jgi:hypothetical protein